MKNKKTLFTILIFLLIGLFYSGSKLKQDIQLGTSDYDNWNIRLGSYMETARSTGYNILINGVNKYLNFNTISGESGYGIRDNGGVIEMKNSGGSWSAGGSSMTYPDAGIALSTGLDWGTSITNNSTNWNTAYGWGNHASGGYLTSELDPVWSLGKLDYYTSAEVDSLGFITSEIDPGVTTHESTYNHTNFLTTVASDSTWTLHNSYPAGCSAGQYVSAIGDTLTCSAPTDNNTTYTAGRSLTLTGTEIASDAELYTDTKCLYFEDPTDADDFKSVWFAKQAGTITSLWCESDQTVTAMFQVDDGTASDVDSVDLTCDATPAEDTSLDGDSTMSAGDRLDLDVASVASTPTWVSMCFTISYDD